jgi:hypothetical protein
LIRLAPQHAAGRRLCLLGINQIGGIGLASRAFMNNDRLEIFVRRGWCSGILNGLNRVDARSKGIRAIEKRGFEEEFFRARDGQA